MLKSKKIYFNPYNLYSMITIVIIMLYSLKWSELYKNLSFPTLTFFISTIIISLFLGNYYKNNFDYETPKKKNPLNIGLITLLIIGGHCLEFLYEGVIPLYEIVIAKSSYSYVNYGGIPTFHVILLTFNSFFTIYLFDKFLQVSKYKTLLLCIVNIIPFFLIYNRALIIIILMSCVSVYIMNKLKGIITFKLILMLTFLAIPVLYIFGISGNIRSSNQYQINNVNDSTLILDVGKANDFFIHSAIPKPFYWGYIYSTVSLANFEINVQSDNHEEITPETIYYFVKQSLIPDFISKRLPGENLTKYEMVTPELNTSIAFTEPYINLGWVGVIIFYLIFTTFIFVYIWIFDKNSSFYITSIAIINTMVIFNFFENALTFSGLSFQLVYPLLFSLVYDKEILLKIKNYVRDNRLTRNRDNNNKC